MKVVRVTGPFEAHKWSDGSYVVRDGPTVTMLSPEEFAQHYVDAALVETGDKEPVKAGPIDMASDKRLLANQASKLSGSQRVAMLSINEGGDVGTHLPDIATKIWPDVDDIELRRRSGTLASLLKPLYELGLVVRNKDGSQRTKLTGKGEILVPFLSKI